MDNDTIGALRLFESNGSAGWFYSLPALEKKGWGSISRLPVSLRIVLESVLRHCDGERITEQEVKTLANWNPSKPASVEIPFVVSRIVLQDFTGVPLIVDLAAMRDAAYEQNCEPGIIEPQVPVDLVVDHSVQVYRFRLPQAFKENLKIEFERNRERYEFLKWGQQAFDSFRVVPPGIGIVHQVNLEYLAQCVFKKEIEGKTIFYPDTLVGTDSHTTMINGLGIVGWGVGGIEAEAGMLGQPVYFLTPEVVGFELKGVLNEGVTATDLTLLITEILRKEKVVGKFVEFYGEGASQLSLADRATIANMAPEYGATMGFFPVDEKTLDYLRMTGRSEEHIQLVRDYFTFQGLFGMPQSGQIDYSRVLQLDLDTVVPSVAGPKRPQDRIDVPQLKASILRLFEAPASEGGFEISPANREKKVSVNFEMDQEEAGETKTVECTSILKNGSILIAAITSCTNTSNPDVMIAAGLLAKNAVELGLTVDPIVKTSLAPGSRVVTEYLERTGLQSYLNQLGFNLVGYGCTTCIGNSGPLNPAIEKAVKENDIVAASVLSGNRNFEARIHSAIRANFLMSPPLVVAYAIVGHIDIDLLKEPLGVGKDGNPVFLKDIWPKNEMIQKAIAKGIQPEIFKSKYNNILDVNPEWQKIDTSQGKRFNWKASSTYIQKPPFFEGFTSNPSKIQPFMDMRPLGIFGDSVTTDHISPAGAIPIDEPAGRYLQANHVEPKDFNSFGSRRGNDSVMTRGTFANVRIRNEMADGQSGGYTKLMPESRLMTIYDACQLYRERGVPLVVFGGHDYGMGSSRDWAAKGTALLGVRAVVARSFERIHRSNLIGMGVLPLEFMEGQSTESLNINGSETFSLLGIEDFLQPQQEVMLEIKPSKGQEQQVPLRVRIDTAIEVKYCDNGGILPYVLRTILTKNK